MGITLLAVSEWLTPLLALATRSLHAPLRRAAPALPTGTATTCNPAARRNTPRANAAPHRTGTRPLRVMRVTEAGHQPAYAGRMAISGRMADVCAELDRLEQLAQRESSH